MSVYSNEKEYDSAVKRIKKMEKHFVRALSAQAELKKAVVAYIKAKEDVREISERAVTELMSLRASDAKASDFLRRLILSLTDRVK